MIERDIDCHLKNILGTVLRQWRNFFMNKKITYVLGGAITLSLAFLTACSSSPYKAEKVDTKLDKTMSLSGEKSIGVKNGDLVFQKKVDLVEEVRRLEYDVYGLEDQVYGSRKFGSLGLYGVYKNCLRDSSDPKNGGAGKLTYIEPIDRVTDKEEDFKVGFDEKEKLVGLSEEFLKDRIDRFKNHKKILQKREDEYQEKLEICRAGLKAQRHEMESSTKTN